MAKSNATITRVLCGLHADPSDKVEEEKFEWYSPKTYYSVRLWQIFQSRYQVLSKLGYGSSSIVWLCRDLRDYQHVALKLCIQNCPSIVREKVAFERLRALRNTSSAMQKYYNSFTVKGVEGAVHNCFVLVPLSISLAVCSQSMKRDLTLFRQTALKVLEALKFRHTEAKLIRCDLRQENFLLSVSSDDVFQEMGEMEARQSSPLKIEGETVIHITPYAMIPSNITNVVLSNFGEARPGNTSASYYDDIQPFLYRAPEVILDIPFSYPTDIWNLWHLFENERLFHPYLKSGGESDLIHLPQMIGALGLPPLSFLKRSNSQDFIREHYFDTDGQWIGRILVYAKRTLEAKKTILNGEDKAEFLRFTRRMLQ